MLRPFFALPILAAALLALPLAAQEDRHPVSADSAWSITGSDCSVDSGWDDGTQVLITLHDDHHDLGVYNKAFRGVVDDKVIPVQFSAGERPVNGRPYQALGHHNADSTSYVSDVDDALLDAVAQAGSFQFYRGKQLLVDLDMAGFADALAAMRACEAANRPHDDGIGSPSGGTDDASGGSYVADVA
ncbi:hypothetical protein [Novosphingobium colocasiae]|uniref:hypothetical protein n=1 Tax=Novosphingobium colocasiae TaxID=1256513 RepID=UPI0035B2331C